MTELRKVSGESVEVIREFNKEVVDMGVGLGRTAQEAIAATVEFARLGYSIREANILAGESLLLSNVGNMEVEQASRHLISTLKAFGIEVDAEGRNVRKVIDLINKKYLSHMVAMPYAYREYAGTPLEPLVVAG